MITLLSGMCICFGFCLFSMKQNFSQQYVQSQIMNKRKSWGLNLHLLFPHDCFCQLTQPSIDFWVLLSFAYDAHVWGCNSRSLKLFFNNQGNTHLIHFPVHLLSSASWRKFSWRKFLPNMEHRLTGCR